MPKKAEEKKQKTAEEIINCVASEIKAKEKKPENFLHVLVFELDKEEYAVELAEIREIIKTPEPTPIPNAPDFIKGIFNLRGQIIAVIDLEKRFNLKRENRVVPEHLIIVESGENIFGIVIDRVSEIIKIPEKSIKKAPELVSAKIRSNYLKGIAIIADEEEDPQPKENGKPKRKKKEGRLLIILDLPKVLDQEELVKLGEEVNKAVKSKN